MKALYYLGIAVGGSLGGWLGSLLDANGFGIWGILGSAIGSALGLWAAYKLAND